MKLIIEPSTFPILKMDQKENYQISQDTSQDWQYSMLHSQKWHRLENSRPMLTNILWAKSWYLLVSFL